MGAKICTRMLGNCMKGLIYSWKKKIQRKWGKHHSGGGTAEEIDSTSQVAARGREGHLLVKEVREVSGPWTDKWGARRRLPLSAATSTPTSLTNSQHTMLGCRVSLYGNHLNSTRWAGVIMGVLLRWHEQQREYRWGPLLRQKLKKFRVLECPVLSQAHELGGLSRFSQIFRGKGDFWVYEIQFEKWKTVSATI